MGAYVQVGVCSAVRVRLADLAGLKLEREEVYRRISEDIVDLAMFSEEVSDERICWTLPRHLLEDGLIPFLRAQHSLLGRRAPRDREAILQKIQEAGTYERIIALADERSLLGFMSRPTTESLAVGNRSGGLRVRINVLIYLVEGKAMMEESQRFFAYIEAMIRSQKNLFPIAAAAKVFLE